MCVDCSEGWSVEASETCFSPDSTMHSLRYRGARATRKKEEEEGTCRLRRSKIYENTPSAAEESLII
jgi:hypothetical protein